MPLFLIEYTIASLVVGLVDLLLAKLAFEKKGPLGTSLSATCVGCALVDVSYLLSIWSDSYFVNSCMSSIYFICIDVMLLFLLQFLIVFTQRKVSRTGKILLRACIAYAVFEAIIFAINPFYEIAVSFIPRASEFAKFSYDMYPFFHAHLLFCYVMIGVAVGLLIQKMIVVPWEYKRQYIYSALGIVLVVAFNGVFLFAPGLKLYNFLDYSILGYSLGIYIFYWACFKYSASGMLNLFKVSVFENLDQGLVLFDFSGKMVLYNDMFLKLLPKIQLKERMSLAEFAKACGILLDESYGNFVIQCYADDGNGKRPLRCDFRTLLNRKGKVISYIFMFSNAVLSTDPLTGFHNWDDFCVMMKQNRGMRHEDQVVATCDIMGLGIANRAKGRHFGDLLIKQLSDLFREKFPAGTYFVRGQDAVLIAICRRRDEAFVLKILDGINEVFERKLQYAVSLCYSEGFLLDAVEVALKGLNQKKLLDRGSSHSVILNSLVQALQECDSDTEEHVRRTQMMGAELGKRIGLSDVDQSNLSLLCLLHDIGKIGVPLEILNKPGKLTQDEWEVLRSHAVKGYQIAKSSAELQGIADMVLHHHERWDGKGYPDGLARESIPLLSRVIAVVDAYDAMVHTRSYRKALPQTFAVEELKKCAGSQFDPFIVSEFIQLLESLPPQKTEEISEAESDEAKKILREEMEQGRYSQGALNSVHALKYIRYTLDEQNFIVDVDEGFEELTGYSKNDVIQLHLNQSDLIPEEDRMEYVRLVTEYVGKGPRAFFEHRIRRKDGASTYVLCFGRRYFDSAVRAGRSEIIVADVSDTYSLRLMVGEERNKVRLQQEQWESAYRRDALTGLLNRSAFKSDTEFKLLEGKAKVMLLMLDVDHFKEYNDEHGHVAGDQFLALIGKTILSSLRQGDIAGRMGGDEFAAALFFSSDCSNEFMYQRAQQIFDKINISLKMNPDGVSMSMGAVIAGAGQDNFNALYNSADKLLYKSKEAGRSRLSVS